jgi:hypothetical protein
MKKEDIKVPAEVYSLDREAHPTLTQEEALAVYYSE